MGRRRPVGEYGRVNAAEVSRPFQVAVVEVSQTRSWADEASLHFRTQQKHWPGRAVVRAAASILRNPAAEFAEAERDDPVSNPCGR